MHAPPDASEKETSERETDAVCVQNACLFKDAVSKLESLSA